MALRKMFKCVQTSCCMYAHFYCSVTDHKTTKQENNEMFGNVFQT